MICRVVARETIMKQIMYKNNIRKRVGKTQWPEFGKFVISSKELGNYIGKDVYIDIQIYEEPRTNTTEQTIEPNTEPNTDEEL